MIGLIDADYIKYLVSYDIEKMFKGGLNPDAVIPYTTIIDLTERRINHIRDNVGHKAKDYIFLFSGFTKDNYRAQIASVKKYKGNRKYTTKYKGEWDYRNMVEKYFSENYNYHREDDLEADDLCVMAHSDNTFIYSNDKDLRMSPGIHYDIKNKKFFKTSVEGGFRILLKQTLSGDGTDNIEGIHGVGKVGADKIVSSGTTLKEATDKVVGEYIKQYGEINGLNRFVEMYTLVSLKTNRGDWTKEKYKVFFDKIDKIINDEGESDFI